MLYFPYSHGSNSVSSELVFVYINIYQFIRNQTLSIKLDFFAKNGLIKVMSID